MLPLLQYILICYSRFDPIGIFQISSPHNSSYMFFGIFSIFSHMDKYARFNKDVFVQCIFHSIPIRLSNPYYHHVFGAAHVTGESGQTKTYFPRFHRKWNPTSLARLLNPPWKVMYKHVPRDPLFAWN